MRERPARSPASSLVRTSFLEEDGRPVSAVVKACLGKEVDREGGKGDESRSILQSGGRYDENDVSESAVEIDNRLLFERLGVDDVPVEAEVLSFSLVNRFFRTFSAAAANISQVPESRLIIQ